MLERSLEETRLRFGKSRHPLILESIENYTSCIFVFSIGSFRVDVTIYLARKDNGFLFSGLEPLVPPVPVSVSSHTMADGQDIVAKPARSRRSPPAPQDCCHWSRNHRRHVGSSLHWPWVRRGYIRGWIAREPWWDLECKSPPIRALIRLPKVPYIC